MTFIESNPSVDMIFFAFENLTDSNPILACGHAGALIIVVSDLPVKLLTLALNYRASFTLGNSMLAPRDRVDAACWATCGLGGLCAVVAAQVQPCRCLEPQ